MSFMKGLYKFSNIIKYSKLVNQMLKIAWLQLLKKRERMRNVPLTLIRRYLYSKAGYYEQLSATMPKLAANI